MRAVHISSLDGPSAVEVVDIPQPEPGSDQVLIRVRAAGVSFPEVLQTRGLYQLKPPVPFVPGSEVAGEVVSAPAGSGLAPGDRVAAMVLLGGFAEYAVTQADVVFPLPDSLSFEEAAAIPLNFLTAHFALVARGTLAEGESVLVHGAAGGIGTASIQVAKAFGAGQVVAVTSTPEKGEFATAAGADEVVLADGFKDAVKAAVAGRRRRHRGRSGRRRPLHRLAALPQGGRPDARHRLHRRRDPHRPGQPAAAQQHQRRRRRAGAPTC